MLKDIIVVIEDSEADAYLVKRRLKEYFPASYQIVRFAMMAPAEEFIAGNTDKIFLILTDLLLPDTAGGKDTFSRLKDYLPSTPVVILTGLQDSHLARSLTEDGADSVLSKDLLFDDPLCMRDALILALARYERLNKESRKTEESLAEKDQIISWMCGGYSLNK